MKKNRLVHVSWKPVVTCVFWEAITLSEWLPYKLSPCLLAHICNENLLPEIGFIFGLLPFISVHGGDRVLWNAASPWKTRTSTGVERLSSLTLQGFPKAQIAVEYILIVKARWADNNIDKLEWKIEPNKRHQLKNVSTGLWPQEWWLLGRHNSNPWLVWAELWGRKMSLSFCSVTWKSIQKFALLIQ